MNTQTPSSLLQILEKQMGVESSGRGCVVICAETMKDEVIRLVASKVLCETQKACGECQACQAIAEGEHPSIRLIEPDGASIRTEQIREMRVSTGTRDLSSSRLVVVISPADKLTVEAANTLLKTLEEPAFFLTFFLVTARPALLLPTILSRCQTIKFPSEGGPTVDPETEEQAKALLDLLDHTTWATFEDVLAYFRSKGRKKWERERVADMGEVFLKTYHGRMRSGKEDAIRLMPHVEWLQKSLAKNMNIALCLERFCMKVVEEQEGRQC